MPPRPRVMLLVVLVMSAGIWTPVSTRADSCDPSSYICQSLNDARTQQGQNHRSLDDIRQKITDVQAKMKSLRALIGQIEGQISAQQVEIDRTGTRIEDLQRQVRFTDADV